MIDSKYTRVSEILSTMKDRSGINPLVLKDKAEIGTEVHSNIHMDWVGVPAVFEIFAVRRPTDGMVLREERRGEGYYNSYLEWKNRENPSYKIMEQRFYDDELMITGQVDALMETKEGFTLIDFKCSHHPEGIIWNMQAHYYCYLMKQNGIKILPKFIFLQLKKDGKFPTIIEFEFNEKVLSRCIEEAILFNEMKNLALCVD